MKRFLVFFAEGFGVGRFPYAPGTMGTAVLGVGTYLLVAGHPWPHLIVCLGLIFLGIWGSSLAAQALQDPDPRRVVVDEWAGYLVATLFLPANLYVGVAAFVLFRILDVLKPQPARLSEGLPGGWGIMCDDLIVGVYANLIIQVGVRVLA